MQRSSVGHSFVFALGVGALAVPTPSASQAPTSQAPTSQAPASQAPASQAPATASMSRDDIVAFAKLEVAIGQARDSAQAQLAQAGNTKPEAQQRLRDQLRTQVEDILHHAGVSDSNYRRKTYIVSTDSAARRIFDGAIAQLTGVPTPGQVQAVVTAPAVKVPPGAVGVHIGHVMNAFGDTPNKRSLLFTALAEARTATQHAVIAARNPTNLDAMKLHAGHVINAVDPSVVPKGPGLGYGVKKAAMGIAMHIELAAKAPGASENVIMHAAHVAMSARNTVKRCDEIVALAKQIQAATSAPAAASLVNQLVPLTAELTTGVDANGDGKITWQDGEGGLQQVREHMNLMLAGEKLPP